MWKLPDGAYGLTPLYLRLRVAERFGRHPRDFDDASPEELAVYLDYDRVREAQEAAEREALLGLGGGLGAGLGGTGRKAGR